MYSADNVVVMGAEGLSDMFACCIGVKQGCPMSPNLFGLFIDGIERCMLQLDSDAPTLNSISIPLFLFADDLCLLSLSHSGLQRQLDELHHFCTAHGLTVNVLKTKTLIFHMRESTAQEPLQFNGGPIDRVQHFRYLGMQFHASRGFSFAADHLADSGRKASHGLHRRCIQMHIKDFALKCKLFDALVTPVLNYCSEIWAVDLPLTSKAAQEIVHTSFLKRLLCVPSTAADDNVRGEFGRYPLYCAWLGILLKFWNRLCTLPQDRLLHHAFIEMRTLHTTGCPCWLTKLDARLEELFGADNAYVLLIRAGQPVEDWKDAVKGCKADYLVRARRRGVDSVVAGTYWGMKNSRYAAEGYLAEVGNSHERRALAMFRTGCHWLHIQRGRHAPRLARDQRICKLCDMGTVEDEQHMLFECPAHATARCTCASLFCSFMQPQTTRDLPTFMQINRDKMPLVAKFVEQCRLRSLAEIC